MDTMRTSGKPVRPRRRVAILVALLLVAATVSAPSVASATPTSTPNAAGASTKGLSYVALGDSYAAGYGLAKQTNGPVPGCGQSALDYPHLVAKKLGLNLIDATCAGATTADVVSTQQKLTAASATPQIDALSRSTKVVTISIGGNDAGLFATASSCIALSATGPVLSGTTKTSAANCRQNLVKRGVDTLRRAVDGPLVDGDPTTTAASGLRATFAAIKKASPAAKVFVVGYPALFPDAANTPKAGCFRPTINGLDLTGHFPKNGFPFTAVDVKYLHSIQVELDAVTQAAAIDAGFTYVSTLSDTEAHSACATRGAYVNGITLQSTHRGRDITVATGALHPNLVGSKFLAATASDAIRREFASRF